MRSDAGKMILILCLLFCFYSFSNAQKRDILAGQFIVQVSSNEDITSFSEQFSSNRSLGKTFNFQKTQIMQQPLNLWLLSADYNQGYETLLENEIKKYNKFLGYRANRIITPRIIPDDPDFSKQWQYINNGTTGGIAGADMDMEQAWDITTGGISPAGDTIVICVIDDGINGFHEDIKSNLWKNYKEIPNNGIDEDNNGYVDDYFGWNISTKDDEVYNGGGHGTPVAGIIGASGNNGIGVSGVNWKVKLMIVNYGFASEANALASYAYAYKMRKLYNESNGSKGAFVVATNASWGIDKSGPDEAPIWCALYDSLGHVGILNCAATTNSDTDVDVEGDLPTSCNSEFLISVTNLNNSDLKVNNAGYGRKSIDIGAYGQQAYTLTRTAYGAFGGTSGASPHVTGVVGLLYSAPCQNFQDVIRTNPAAAALIAKDMILHGAVALPVLDGITTTGGKLNAFRSVKNLMNLCQPCSVPAGISLIADNLSVTMTWFSEEGASEIAVRYRKINENGWKELKNVKKGITFSGLDFCTEYEFQISSNCGLLSGNYSYSKFIKTTGCCNAPELKKIESDQNSITLSWTTDESAVYFLQYKDNESDWIDTMLNNPSYKILNLEECEGISLRIQASCTTFGNISEFTPLINTSTTCGNCTGKPYCTFSRKDATQEWIESFSLGDITSISGSSVQGYRNFAGLVNFSIIPGNTYPFHIDADYSGNVYPDFYKIYVDLDQNGEFLENEMLFKTLASVKDSVSGTIQIPSDIASGYTRLRLIMSYEDFGGACDDEIFEYGEVEDYCVFVQKDSCVHDQTLRLIRASSNNITFEITGNDSSSNKIKLFYRERGTLPWNEVIGQDSVSMEGLRECTVYEYQYLTQCGLSFSDPSPIDTIKTFCPNNVHDLFSSIYVAPNPATNEITLYYLGYVTDIVDYGLINSEGKPFMSVPKMMDSQTVKLNISFLPSGMYLLKLMTKDGRYISKKFIKQ